MGRDIVFNYACIFGRAHVNKYGGRCIKLNKTPAETFTPPAEKKIGSKWALCTTAQAGNIKSGYLRILLYIAVVLCLVIGQLHIDKCVYHAIGR